MGNSTYTSNIVGKDINISGIDDINATNVTAGTKVKVGSYIQLGDHQYIFFGSIANTQAAVVANATSVDASCKGSMTLNYNSTQGNIWYHLTDTTATIASSAS